MAQGGLVRRGARSSGFMPNVLWIFLDDVGIDLLSCYDDCNDWPGGFGYFNTPNINALAADGMRFRRAYAAPTCSPARAMALTGRYPVDTQISHLVRADDIAKLSTSEQTMFDLLEGQQGANLRTALYGKWHLSFGENDYSGITDQGGFTEYKGCSTNPNIESSTGYGGTSVTPEVSGGGPGSWYETETFTLTEQTGYITTREADDVIKVVSNNPQPVSGGPSPWVVAWWCHSVHTPLHWAPTSLHSYGAAPPFGDIGAYGAQRTMLEAVDTEIGRVLDAMDGYTADNTYVILCADNGSIALTVDRDNVNNDPNSTGQPLPPVNNYNPGHFKGLAYDQGIRVPMIVRGPRVQKGSVCDSLVTVQDLFATIPDLAIGSRWDDNLTASGVTAKSFKQCLANPAFKPHAGEHIWAGHWQEPGYPLADERTYAVDMSVQHSDHGYRLVVVKDLVTDPWTQEWYLWGTDPTAPNDQHEATPLDPSTTGTTEYRAALAWLNETFRVNLPDLST